MPQRIFRFGKFEVNADDRELHADGTHARLQEKPLLLLTTLLENPQQLVTREELRKRMWSSDTFVDFEQGINIAIKKVREALGDSADEPKYIQTIAKKGYKFLLPVEIVDSKPVILPPPSIQETASAGTSSESLLTATSPVRHWARRWTIPVLATGMLSALGLWLYEVLPKPRHTVQVRSLAVLPLRDLSPDPGQEYVADGITEELITNLAQSLRLRVISRTSVMRYKQTTEPIAQIARELGAEAILEGSVARSGDHVMVTLQLIDATEDRHLWAQRFDRNLGDLPSMEAELAQQIASHVGATLNSEQVLGVAKSHPVDPQVYELCLLGRFHWNKRTAADLKKSAEYYQQAIARDPGYAPAYAGLADAYALLPSYDSVGFLDSYAKAAASAHHALELDDSLAQAHATLGLIGLNQWPDWMRMEPEFRRAIELNPSYAPAHQWFAFYLYFSDRRDEALAEMEIARQLDPLSAIINADEGAFLYAVRRYEAAKARLRQAIELAPDFGQPHETLALVELESGNPSAALNEARAGLALDPNNPRTIGEAGYVLATSGRADDARGLLARLKNLDRQGSGRPVFAAFIYVGLGQRNDALDALEQATDPKTLGLHSLGLWHILDALQDDSRYQKLIAPGGK